MLLPNSKVKVSMPILAKSIKLCAQENIYMSYRL